MVRRLVAAVLWMAATLIVLMGGLRVLSELLRLVGALDDQTARTAAAVGGVVLSSVAVVYVGILAYSGRLPWTPETPSRSRSGRLDVVGTVVAIGLVTIGTSAIVSAAVSSSFALTLYEARIEAGTTDLTVSIDSEILREIRDLRVRLPSDYATSEEERYPLLLLLDGRAHLDHTSQALRVASRLDLVDEMIIAAVPSGMSGRSADFLPPGLRVGATSGRADDFLTFLETEALPALERELRVGSTRLLVGHSLGGLFVTYSLIERPALFDGRFAFSPSWWVGDEQILRDLRLFLSEGAVPTSYLYLSLGAREAGDMHNVFEAGVQLLSTLAPEQLEWEAEVVDGAGHGSNPYHSTPMALRGFGEFLDAQSDVESSPATDEGSVP